MIRILGLLMAGAAIVFVSLLNHIVIENHVQFPTFGIMAVVAGRG